MENLTTKQIVDLAYDNGLDLNEDSKYGSTTCDEILSFKKFCKTSGYDPENDETYQWYINSIEGHEVFEN